MKKRTKILLWGLASLVVLGAVFVGGFAFMVRETLGPPAPLPFVREQWLKGLEQDGFPRLGMAEYLVENNTLDGMKKQEVIRMLGKADAAGGDVTMWVNGHYSRADLLYRLGPGLWISEAWLVVRFDQQGRVAEYGQVNRP